MFWFFGPQSTWDLSLPTRDQTHTPCIGRQSLNHWTTREVPTMIFFLVLYVRINHKKQKVLGGVGME